jgi:hypothetical protein
MTSSVPAGSFGRPELFSILLIMIDDEPGLYLFRKSFKEEIRILQAERLTKISYTQGNE